MTISVLVAEGHRLVRDSLVRLLDAHDDIEVVGETGRGDAAVDLLAALQPDVAIVGTELPGLDGLQLCAEAKRRACPETAVLLLAGHVDASTVHRGLAAGATGYVHKDDAVEELLTALRAVAVGRQHLSMTVQQAAEAPVAATGATSYQALLDARSYEELLTAIEAVDAQALAGAPAARAELSREVARRRAQAQARLAPFEALTPREREVLAALAVGRSADEIAEEQVVSVATVRSHIRGVLDKLGVNSQVAAVALAWQRGWAADAVPSDPVPVWAAS